MIIGNIIVGKGCWVRIHRRLPYPRIQRVPFGSGGFLRFFKDLKIHKGSDDLCTHRRWVGCRGLAGLPLIVHVLGHTLQPQCVAIIAPWDMKIKRCRQIRVRVTGAASRYTYGRGVSCNEVVFEQF